MRAIKIALVALALFVAGVSPAIAAFTETQKANVQGAGPALGSGNISVSSGHLIVILGSIRGTASGTVTVLDGALNSYTVVPSCIRITANQGFIAWATVSTALSAQAITVTYSGTTTAMTYHVWDVTGQQASSPEDTAARACNTNTTATTSPTVTSGAPADSGDIFFSEWAVGSTSSGASFTTSGSWLPTNGYGTGNSSVLGISDYLVASGGGAQTNNPTTNSEAYAMPITAFIASGAVATPKHMIMESIP